MKNLLNEIPEDAWRPEDFPAMLAIWNEIVRDGKTFPQEEELSEEEGREFFAAQSHCGVARNFRGEVDGFYILHPNNVGRCGHICNASYGVAKTARGKGTGEKLVRASLKAAALLGFQLIQFNAVVENNNAANALYNKLGFQKLGVIPGGFRDKNGNFQNICLYWRYIENSGNPEKNSNGF